LVVCLEEVLGALSGTLSGVVCDGYLWGCTRSRTRQAEPLLEKEESSVSGALEVAYEEGCSVGVGAGERLWAALSSVHVLKSNDNQPAAL
jgi:hypothetical protein